MTGTNCTTMVIGFSRHGVRVPITAPILAILAPDATVESCFSISITSASARSARRTGTRIANSGNLTAAQVLGDSIRRRIAIIRKVKPTPASTPGRTCSTLAHAQRPLLPVQRQLVGGVVRGAQGRYRPELELRAVEGQGPRFFAANGFHAALVDRPDMRDWLLKNPDAPEHRGSAQLHCPELGGVCGDDLGETSMILAVGVLVSSPWRS